MWTKRGKARLILIFSTNTNCENMAYRSFRSEKYSARGVRKVSTGRTGMWQPSVHSDVAFWSFDVGSSMIIWGGAMVCVGGGRQVKAGVYVKRCVQNLQKKGLEWACRPSTTETSKEPERGVKSHPPKRGNSMVSRVHVHQFSASVWRAARLNVASRTYKKKAWNELVGPALQRPAKSQKGASKATLRNGETAWCRGFTCTHFRPPFGGLRG